MRVVVGQGSCGIASGAKKTAAEFEKQIAEKKLGITVGTTGCVGTCYLEPIVDIYDDDGKMTRYVKVQPENVAEIVEKHLLGHQVAEDLAISEEDKEFIAKQKRVVLRNCGIINPENIDDYIAADGYKAIEKVLTTMKPEEVIEEIKISASEAEAEPVFRPGSSGTPPSRVRARRNISSATLTRATRAPSWTDQFSRATLIRCSRA